MTIRIEFSFRYPTSDTFFEKSPLRACLEKTQKRERNSFVSEVEKENTLGPSSSETLSFNVLFVQFRLGVNFPFWIFNTMLNFSYHFLYSIRFLNNNNNNKKVIFFNWVFVNS